MRSRWLPLMLLGFAVALYAGQVALAAETHEGKVVEAASGKLIMTDKDGKRQTHEVPVSARITCDGKACKLEDLKAGFGVKVTVDKDANGKLQVTQIAATSRAP